MPKMVPPPGMTEDAQDDGDDAALHGPTKRTIKEDVGSAKRLKLE